MSYERRPREMHKATCGDCGNECEVPFEPRQDKPVYCNECFQKHKPQGGGGSGRRLDDALPLEVGEDLDGWVVALRCRLAQPLGRLLGVLRHALTEQVAAAQGGL